MSSRLEAPVPEITAFCCAMAVSSSDVSGSAGNSPGGAFLPVQDTHVFRLLQNRVQALEASLEVTRQVALASCPREALESLENRLNMLELRLNASHDVSAGAIDFPRGTSGASTSDLSFHRSRLAAAGQLEVHPLGPLLHSLPLDVGSDLAAGLDCIFEGPLDGLEAPAESPVNRVDAHGASGSLEEHPPLEGVGAHGICLPDNSPPEPSSNPTLPTPAFTPSPIEAFSVDPGAFLREVDQALELLTRVQAAASFDPQAFQLLLLQALKPLQKSSHLLHELLTVVLPALSSRLDELEDFSGMSRGPGVSRNLLDRIVALEANSGTSTQRRRPLEPAGQVPVASVRRVADRGVLGWDALESSSTHARLRSARALLSHLQGLVLEGGDCPNDAVVQVLDHERVVSLHPLIDSSLPNLVRRMASVIDMLLHPATPPSSAED